MNSLFGTIWNEANTCRDVRRNQPYLGHRSVPLARSLLRIPSPHYAASSLSTRVKCRVTIYRLSQDVTRAVLRSYMLQLSKFPECLSAYSVRQHAHMPEVSSCRIRSVHHTWKEYQVNDDVPKSIVLRVICWNRSQPSLVNADVLSHYFTWQINNKI